MARDSVLPSLKHFLIGLLFGLNSASVFELGELSSTLLVHFFLKVPAHGSVTFVNLLEDVRLMSLACLSSIQLLLLVKLVLSLDLCIDCRLLMINQPLLFLFTSLLEHNISLAVSVYVLQEIDAGLVFSAPLLFPRFPLLSVLDCNQIIDHLFISGFILLALIVIFLQFKDILFTGFPFQLFEPFKSCLSLKRLFEHRLITLLLSDVC